MGTSLFGASAVPLLATLALWFGGLGTFIALQAVSRRALTSRQPSALLTLRSFAPAAGLGALQGALVASVVQLAASYGWAEWWALFGVSVVAGIAFAAGANDRSVSSADGWRDVSCLLYTSPSPRD